MFANRLRVTTAALAVTLAGAGLAATVGVTGVTLAGNISWDSAPTGATVAGNISWDSVPAGATPGNISWDAVPGSAA